MERGAWQATVHAAAKRAEHDLVTKRQREISNKPMDKRLIFHETKGN